MSDKPKHLSAAEITAIGDRALAWLQERHFVKEVLIEDYPIGGRNRGKCLISVEYKRGGECRSLKATTNKYGRWCAPKKSTYGSRILIPCDNLDGKWPVGWVGLSHESLYTSYAAGVGEVHLQAPHWTKPRREPETVRMTWRKARMVFDNDGVTTEPQPDEVQETVYEADTPELCDAYEAWERVRESLHEYLRARVLEAFGG